MSRRTAPPAAKLLFSVIFAQDGAFDALLPALAERFGPVESASDPFPFDFTEYYAAEMGPGLRRRFVVMRDPVPRDSLAAVKVGAEALEIAASAGGRRTVNIDPGLLTDENFVLATGKNYSHRIYLRDGVYADLALVYRKGDYRPLPWTYPDYASGEIRAYLDAVRSSCRESTSRGGGGAVCG